MQIPELDRELGYFDLISDEDDYLFPIADGQPAIDGKNPQAPNTEPFVTDVPSSSSESVRNDEFLFEKCLADLSDVFPDISSEYARGLFDTRMQLPLSSQHLDQIHDVCHDLTIQILDAGPYPKEKDRINELKRKRSLAVNSDEKDALQWKSDRKGMERASYLNAAYVSTNLLVFPVSSNVT